MHQPTRTQYKDQMMRWPPTPARHKLASHDGVAVLAVYLVPLPLSSFRSPCSKEHIARGSDLVRFREVIGKHLIKPAFVLGFTFQVVEMLDQEIAHRVSWLELEGEHATRREDTEEHLHAVANLAHPGLSFAHATFDPSGHMAVASEIVGTACLSSLRLSTGCLIYPFGDGGERCRRIPASVFCPAKAVE